MTGLRLGAEPARDPSGTSVGRDPLRAGAPRPVMWAPVVPGAAEPEAENKSGAVRVEAKP